MDQIEILSEASYTNSAIIKQLVSEIIPTYHPKKKQDEIETRRIKKLNEEKVVVMAGGVK